MDELIAAHTIPGWFERECRKRELIAVQAAELVTVDGRLDEAVWSNAPRIEHFLDWRKLRLESLETVGQLAYDEQTLYVAIECFDPNPSEISTAMLAADQYRLCDSVEVLVASKAGAGQFAHWIVDSHGTVFDARTERAADGRIEYTPKWNGGSVEIGAAPLVPLRWSPKQSLRIGVPIEVPGVVCTFVIDSREGTWRIDRRFGNPRRPEVSADRLFALGVAGQALAMPAHLSSLDPPKLNIEEGTIEFWMQPAWNVAPRSSGPRGSLEHTLLNIGPVRPDHLYMVTVRLGLDEKEDPITAAEYNTFLRMVGEAIVEPVVDGEQRVWHPITVRFPGPEATETDNGPNPFLDYRLQVAFSGPSGQQYDVPGFFDGNGSGGGSGDVWCARFTPNEAGRWSFQASFRSGKEIAVSLETAAGRPIGCDGLHGSFDVAPGDPQAPGFLKWGRLAYVGGHYLKFVDGPYWIRGGTDSPENFFAYAGFDRTAPSHRYGDHVTDWRPGDPDWNEGKGRGIIGAVNYLGSRGVNSIYFLTHNIGGDGKDVWPWTGRPDPNGSPKNDNLHYDIGKLRQWETVFAHAQRQGVFLHFVFNEAEKPNKRELDNGELGTERKLYYRELIARFGHHLALEWNLCEEYNLGFDFGPDRVRRLPQVPQRFTVEPDLVGCVDCGELDFQRRRSVGLVRLRAAVEYEVADRGPGRPAPGPSRPYSQQRRLAPAVSPRARRTHAVDPRGQCAYR